jgi:hypothetical protein
MKQLAATSSSCGPGRHRTQPPPGEPRLVDSTSDEMKGRDRAIKKWNDAVATPASGIDKVPGK